MRPATEIFSTLSSVLTAELGDRYEVLVAPRRGSIAGVPIARRPDFVVYDRNRGSTTIVEVNGSGLRDELSVAAAWQVLYQAQRKGELAVTGPYAYVRHPQYVGFILVMFGFLLQWPTLLTLAMFPVLVWMYVRLAREEEREAAATLGTAYESYAAAVPGFIPSLSARAV